MVHPYTPENPHPFDDPNLQRGNPDFPIHTYVSDAGMPDPVLFERMGTLGQTEYYAQRLQADFYRRSLVAQQLPLMSAELVTEEQTSRNPYLVPEHRRIGPFPVTVNHNLTVDEMIAAGNYDKSNSNISEIRANCFPDYTTEQKTEDVSVELISFPWSLPVADRPGLFERMNIQSVTFLELLSFGAQYPDVQRGGAVVGSERVNEEERDIVLYLSYIASGVRVIKSESYTDHKTDNKTNSYSKNIKFAVVRK